MAARPRTVSDTDILDAAARIVARHGPVATTLATIGEAVGLSPAALIQRFGSKRGLLLALARQSVDGIEACFCTLRGRYPAALDALVAAATEMAQQVRHPADLANHLALLQMDLRDPDLRRLVREASRRMVAGYRILLDEAVAAGTLTPCDTARLARAVAAVATGSLIAWGVYREGTASGFVRQDLETLLVPYRGTLAPPTSAGRRSTQRVREPRRSRTTMNESG